MGLKLCLANIYQNQQREQKEAAATAQFRTFTIGGDNLKQVENFKYSKIQFFFTDFDAMELFLILPRLGNVW